MKTSKLVDNPYIVCVGVAATPFFRRQTMTELCESCLGCNKMELEDFNGVHKCPNYVDGREPKGQEDIYMDIIEMFEELD